MAPDEGKAEGQDSLDGVVQERELLRKKNQLHLAEYTADNQ
jgi:hypothetical protein